MEKKFFVSTPIYYANSTPHIGHAYSSFLADIYARYKRILGYKVKFSTGNDENSQKVLQVAEKKGINPQEYLDKMAEIRKNTRNKLNISYTDFIRTTSPKHKEIVQKMLEITWKNGDIYKGKYEGYYCVSCEAFKLDKDLEKKIINGKETLICPDHQKEVSKISENNRFFKLSKYQKEILDFYKKNEKFIIPENRQKEILNFIQKGLNDFSISRETNKFGIPLPFDEKQVTYVWYDALFNYYTVAGEEFWNNETEKLHIMGKDIIKFHGIYWLGMLMSAGLPLPDKEIVTGFFTVNGQKMSKTIGNVINPNDLIDKYPRDLITFYFFYDKNIGSDGDFSEKRMLEIYNKMLIGGRGNLINRVTKLAQKINLNEFLLDEKYLNEILNTDSQKQLLSDPINFINQNLETANLKQILSTRYELIQNLNEFIQKHEIRVDLDNTENHKKLKFLLYMIYFLSIITSPILIDGFKKTQEIFNFSELSHIDTTKTNENLSEILKIKKGKIDLKPKFLYKKLN